MPERIYLDNAATSWPKPECVYAAVDRYQRENGASAGRSTYGHASQASSTVDQARTQVARLLNAAHDSHICFTCNGTDSLNLCIHGCLRNGDHVVTSELEHNSVLRPLEACSTGRGVVVEYARTDASGRVSLSSLREKLRAETRMVVLSHASNVTGAVQPIEEVSALCRDHGVTFLLDAAQTLGHWALDVSALGVEMVAASGHKGLLGPLGTGLVYFAPGVGQRIEPLRQGGTGSQSEETRQPDSLPDKFEPGNMNVPALAGLAAGAAYVHERFEKLVEHEQALTRSLIAGLRDINAIQVHGPASGPRVGVVSFSSAAYDTHELAILLDSTQRIQVRAGVHCAPLVHERLGTRGTGTVRVSFGPFNTASHVESLLAVLEELH